MEDGRLVGKFSEYDRGSLTSSSINVISNVNYCVNVDNIETIEDVKVVLDALSIYFGENSVIFDKLPDRLKKVVK